MPNPLTPFRNCSQAPAQEALDRAESRALDAQQAFQGFMYRAPREADFTVPQWQEYNRLRNDFLVQSERRDRAFLAKTMCETRYTIPPRPHLEPPKVTRNR